MKNPNDMTGDERRALRLSWGLKPADACRILGIGARSLFRYEAGDAMPRSVAILITLYTEFPELRLRAVGTL